MIIIPMKGGIQLKQIALDVIDKWSNRQRKGTSALAMKCDAEHTLLLYQS